jgi:hypothetical protein
LFATAASTIISLQLRGALRRGVCPARLEAVGFLSSQPAGLVSTALANFFHKEGAR